MIAQKSKDREIFDVQRQSARHKPARCERKKKEMR